MSHRVSQRRSRDCVRSSGTFIRRCLVLGVALWVGLGTTDLVLQPVAAQTVSASAVAVESFPMAAARQHSSDQPLPSATIPASTLFPSTLPTPVIAQGTLLIGGGGIMPEVVYDRFIELAGGRSAKLVIVSTASTFADDHAARTAYWAPRVDQPPVVLHTRSRAVANTDAFLEPLKTATAVWFVGGNQNWVAEAYLGTQTELAFHAVLARGGVIGGTSAGAAIMSRVMICGGRTEPVLGTGFGFLPGTIVDQHFIRRSRHTRLTEALQLRPGHVGIGIDEGTALIVRPSGLEVIGNSEVVACLAPVQQRPGIAHHIRPGETLDLPRWSFAAAQRARIDSYQRIDRPSPNLRSGAVVMSGGRPPQRAVEEFLAAAGGKDARVILVSQGLDDADETPKKLQETFAASGAANVLVCRAESRAEMEAPEWQASIAEAKGVWFVGGQEQSLVDLVAASTLRNVVADVLNRGGAIGGSSAGAKIHGDGLVKPTTPDQARGTGLVDCALGLLPGLVIEQATSSGDATAALAGALRDRFPHCVGLELQENAAVVVRGHVMEVVGPDSVAIVEQSTDDKTEPAKEVVRSGQRYDFRERRLVEVAVGDSER